MEANANGVSTPRRGPAPSGRPPSRLSHPAHDSGRLGRGRLGQAVVPPLSHRPSSDQRQMAGPRLTVAGTAQARPYRFSLIFCLPLSVPPAGPLAFTLTASLLRFGLLVVLGRSLKKSSGAARGGPAVRFASVRLPHARRLPGTGPQTGTQPPSEAHKPLVQAVSTRAAACLENRYASFRRDEGSNPSPSLDKAGFRLFRAKAGPTGLRGRASI